MLERIRTFPMIQRIVAFAIAALVALVLMFSSPGISEAHKFKNNGQRHHHGKVNNNKHHGKNVNKKKRVNRGNVTCKAVNVAGLTNTAKNYQICQRINA